MALLVSIGLDCTGLDLSALELHSFAVLRTLLVFSVLLSEAIAINVPSAEKAKTRAGGRI